MGTVANVQVQPMSVEWSGSALGFVDGDLSFATTEDLVDVTAHEEGTNILSAIRTGKSAEITMALKETNTALVQYLFQQAGALATASGAASATIGWGNSKDFTQVTTQAGKLVLHPVKKAAADLSEDIAAWKAYPVVDSFDFSGENPSVINVTFRIFPDLTKADSHRLFVIGDHTDGDFATTS